MKLAMCIAALILAGCSTSHIMIGEKRPPLKPEEVKLYRTPPPQFEEIAMIDADNSGSFAITGQGKTDAVINRMKAEAASLGANGLLIEGVGNQAAGAVGTGVATANGTAAYGTGISASVFLKVGKGLAIYVPPK